MKQFYFLSYNAKLIHEIAWHLPKMKSINSIFSLKWRIHIDTVKNKWLKSNRQKSYITEHPTIHTYSDKICLIGWIESAKFSVSIDSQMIQDVWHNSKNFLSNNFFLMENGSGTLKMRCLLLYILNWTFWPFWIEKCSFWNHLIWVIGV